MITEVEVLKSEQQSGGGTFTTTDGASGFKDAGVLTRTLDSQEPTEALDPLNHTEAFLVTTEKPLPVLPTESSSAASADPSLTSAGSSSSDPAPSVSNSISSASISANSQSSGVNSNYTVLKVDDDLNCLEGDEWRCRDGLCIPQEKRCDGHFNCYDHSDEYNCDPCPLSEGYFRCGSETSCLDPSKRCDSIIDCWDGSDEHLCIK